MERRIPIVRMDCPTCIPTIEKSVTRLEGVEDAKGNYISKNLKVVYDSDKVSLEEIEEAIEDVGYQIAYKKYPSVLDRLRGLFGGEKKEDTGVETIWDEDFPGKVLHSSRPAVILFSSKTCPSCQMFKPRYQDLADAHETADFYEMDISVTRRWQEYGVMTIPTVLVFKEGGVAERFSAVLRTQDIEKTLS
jgi:copper chaperone CopZ